MGPIISIAAGLLKMIINLSRGQVEIMEAMLKTMMRLSPILMMKAIVVLLLLLAYQIAVIRERVVSQMLVEHFKIQQFMFLVLSPAQLQRVYRH